MFRIISKEKLNPVVYRMVVEAPRIAASALPGQFLIVRDGEKGERIPLTISDYDPEKGTVTIVIQEIGASSKDICLFEPGESFADVVGPLGVPSDFTGMSAEELAGKRYVFVAGGVGTAPVYPQAKWLKDRGIPVDVIIGAKNAGLQIYQKEMAAVCDNLYVCTDDGSEGFHGLVTARLEKLVTEEGRSYTNVVAIGPMIMMKFATLTARKLGLPITVSLNTLMVDGTGMCGACRVSVGGKMRFACVEGPEFDGYLVDFDEAMRRQGMYREQEREADQKRSDYLQKMIDRSSNAGIEGDCMTDELLSQVSGQCAGVKAQADAAGNCSGTRKDSNAVAGDPADGGNDSKEVK